MKIAVVGAGNAGCFTALHYAFHLRKADFDIELIYNPDKKKFYSKFRKLRKYLEILQISRSSLWIKKLYWKC